MLCHLFVQHRSGLESLVSYHMTRSFGMKNCYTPHVWRTGHTAFGFTFEEITKTDYTWFGSWGQCLPCWSCNRGSGSLVEERQPWMSPNYDSNTCMNTKYNSVTHSAWHKKKIEHLHCHSRSHRHFHHRTARVPFHTHTNSNTTMTN